MDRETAILFFDAVISLLAIVNPIGGLPTFVSMTEDMETQERRKLFRLAGVTALIVIIVMALVGQVLLEHVFRISIHEFMFGGGLLLLVVGIKRIIEAGPKQQLSLSSDPAARRSESIRLAVSPIAVPLMVGPGSILTVMLIARRNNPIFAVAAALAAFAIVIIILNYAHLLYKIMGKVGSLAIGRVMQIFIVAIGVKFCFQAIKAIFPELTGMAATLPAVP